MRVAVLVLKLSAACLCSARHPEKRKRAGSQGSVDAISVQNLDTILSLFEMNTRSIWQRLTKVFS